MTDINNDTICAVSTPPGVGGIAVIRVSGHDAFEIVNKTWKGKDLNTVESHTAHYGEIIDRNSSNEIIDECVATIFRGPKSYTGEDTVELSIHGSKWVQRRLLQLLIDSGCRLAEPGEYTRRSVMNGRMDLAQAEGVADIIASSSHAAHRIAIQQLKGGVSNKLAELRQQLIRLASLMELELDFSEEDVEFADRKILADTANIIRQNLEYLHRSYESGNAIKEGIPVAIIGATNVGKSSLLNALLGDERAIVSDIHGTTRDTIEETLEIEDYLFRFIDTAGMRKTDDPVERIGIDRSIQALNKARIIILLLDASQIPLERLNRGYLRDIIPSELSKHLSNTEISIYRPHLIIGVNKIDLTHDYETLLQGISDLIAEDNISQYSDVETIAFSARERTGIHNLTRSLASIVDRSINQSGYQDDIIITSVRQAIALKDGIAALDQVILGLQNGLETDLLAQHLRDATSAIASITGEITSTDVLNNIFSSFCIGK